MSVILPVKLFPLALKANNSGGLVVAVIIGLALYAASQKKATSNVTAAQK